MKALTPYIFGTGNIVDEEAVNGNLRRAAADVARNLSRRYTRMPAIIVPLDGVVDTDTAALRSIVFDRPTADNPVEIIKVELFIYAATGVTWTLSVSGATWESLSVDTAGASSEAYAVSAQPIAVPNGGVTFTLSGSAAGTITRGWMVLHCRADRGVQGASPDHSGYEPSYVNADTSSAGSVLDAELEALADAVARDGANDVDLRCACVLARNFSTSKEWRFPSGGGADGLAWRGYLVAGAGDEVAIGGTLDSGNIVATGTGDIVAGTGLVDPTADDPTDTADDITVTLSPTGTVELAYAFIWWS